MKPLAAKLGSPGNIENWIVENGIYRREIQEIVRTPVKMLEDLQDRGALEGDCDDFSTLASCLLLGIGVPHRFVAVQTEPGVGFDHVFVEIPTGSGAYRLDVTVYPEVPIPEYERMELYVG